MVLLEISSLSPRKGLNEISLSTHLSFKPTQLHSLQQLLQQQRSRAAHTAVHCDNIQKLFRTPLSSAKHIHIHPPSV